MEILFTEEAEDRLKEIYKYFSDNASKSIGNRIINQILKQIDKLLTMPEMGQKEDQLSQLNQNHRYILSGNYKIIYRIFNDSIVVTDIFHSNQDPSKIKF